MAFIESVNNTPATGGVAVYTLKELLKTAGWTVLSSSDGTTYNSGGDQITSGSAGAGGMGNTSAWFRIRMPTANGVQRQYVFQRGAGNHFWRIKYSYSAGFTGGSPSATQTPSATDEQYLTGGGTDASPTYTAQFGTDGTYRYHVRADNAAPYGVASLGYPTGGGNPTHAWLFDPLVAGSYDALDVDPYVYYTSGFGGGSFAYTELSSEAAGTYNKLQAWLKKGLAGEGFTYVTALLYYSNAGYIVAPSLLGTDPSSSKDVGLPIVYARRSSAVAPTGYKGMSSLLRWQSGTRATGDTLTVSTSRDRIIVRDTSVVWGGVLPSV